MKFATWNVDSLNVRLPHVLDWLRDAQPDVLCLQETKQEDSKFPYDVLKDAGYEAVRIGQRVTVHYDDVTDEVTLPKFRLL